MGDQVVIADAEVACAAEALYVAAQSIQHQVDRLGGVFASLESEKAISSELTADAFEEIKRDVSGIAKEIESCVANLTTNTLSFISELDAVDTFVY